ncbi:hypothetical protein M8J77_021657 [Diaphorina citri]|nr:hypothetical protein M8J77_021657 [Diaphorina citri]
MKVKSKNQIKNNDNKLNIKQISARHPSPLYTILILHIPSYLQYLPITKASADTQARVTVDIDKYVAQLKKRVAEQEQLIALLNDKVARYGSEGVASQSYAGAVRRDRSHGSRACAAVSGGIAVAVGDVRTADSFQIIGSKKTDISSVPSVRYSQIFVTRINPNISAKELGEDLRSGAPELSSVKCTKLKTKYDSYASFHSIVPEAEKVLISSEEVWPEGALVKLESF